MGYPRFPQRTPGETPDPSRPIHWVGTGDPARSDERNRELLLLGTYAPTGPLSQDRFFGYELAGSNTCSLHWLLGERGPAPRLVEADDVAVARVARSFDLPAGASPGSVISALLRLVSGQNMGLRTLAVLQNAFCSIPELFEQLWAQAGGGQPIRQHPFEAEQAVWHPSASGQRLELASQVVQQSQDVMRRHGPRKQLFGPRVLRGDLGPCPQCKGEMVRTPEGPRCLRDLKKKQYTPPDETAWLFGENPEDGDG